MARDLLLLFIVLRVFIMHRHPELIAAVRLQVPALLLAEVHDLPDDLRLQIARVVDLALRRLDQRAVVGDDWHIDAERLRHRQGCSVHAARRDRHDDASAHRLLHGLYIFTWDILAARQQRPIKICHKEFDRHDYASFVLGSYLILLSSHRAQNASQETGFAYFFPHDRIERWYFPDRRKKVFS